MRFSVGLPTGMEGLMYPVPFAGVEDILHIARQAETLGYDGVWGNDHLTTQHYVRQEFSTPPNYWEVLITLAAVAVNTKRLRIATGVLVPALRQDIVVLAKQLATLDHISGGRLDLGMGVGAYREEFEALHPQRDIHRGKALEEAIQALHILFSQRQASWEGTFYHFKDVEMYPKPLQDLIPLYVGGNNVNALRRAAQYGQGWLGAGMPVEQFSSAIQTLNIFLEQAGRQPGCLDIAPQFSVCMGKTSEKALDTFRRSQMYSHLVSLSKTTLKDQVNDGFKFEDIDLIGSSQQIIERIGGLQDTGVTHMAGLLFTARNVEEYLEQMQQFAEEVIPLISS